MRIASDSKLVLIGDSITDCGRMGLNPPLGNGYVKLLADLFVIRNPELNPSLTNRGIGGDRITGLRSRWNEDVIKLDPDWLCVLIGINDLHSVLRDDPNAVYPQLYRQAYDDILLATKKELPDCKLILMEPFYMATESTEDEIQRSVLRLLPDYLNVVHAMADRYAALLVRLHEEFQRLLEHHEPQVFCPETVHPNMTGHLAIAESLYAVLDS